MAKMVVFKLLCAFSFVGTVLSRVSHKTKCNDLSMDIRVPSEGVEKVFHKFSEVPGCQTQERQHDFFISLKFDSSYYCGLNSFENPVTGKVIYKIKISIRETGGEVYDIYPSCDVYSTIPSTWSTNRVKRSLFPPEFVEPDSIKIVTEVSGRAPIPELSVGVRQNGILIGDQVTVTPGAPLTMEVYLDDASLATYGILVSYMIVTDNTKKNETIIFNGCTQDRYLFENFQTKDGDLLKAKFRAFKFPESDYLMFKVTVDVCLDKCQGIRCSSGEDGYGRKKRSLPNSQADPNKLFEVSMMTYLKFASDVDVAKSFQAEDVIQKFPGFSYREEKEIFIIETLPSDDSTAYLYYDHRSSAPCHQLPYFSFLILVSLFMWNIQN